MNISKLKDDEKVKSKLKNIITNLFDYTATHFSNEQKYMEEINYPELISHKNLHKNMLNMLTTLLSELNKLELQEIEKLILDFIEDYFITHIVLEDKKIQLWNTSLVFGNSVTNQLLN
jgi:hemerythrin